MTGAVALPSVKGDARLAIVTGGLIAGTPEQLHRSWRGLAFALADEDGGRPIHRSGDMTTAAHRPAKDRFDRDSVVRFMTSSIHFTPIFAIGVMPVF